MPKQYIGILRTNVSSLDFRFKKTDDKRNYILDEIKHNDLMIEKYKKTCNYLNYVEHLLILAYVFQFMHLLHYFVFLLVLQVLQ